MTAAASKAEALEKTRRWDEICDHASMPNKGWTYSFDDSDSVTIGPEEDGVEKVLGLKWNSKTDSFIFDVKLKVRIKVKSGGWEEIQILTVEELQKYRREILTRRALLSNIASIFNPDGSLCPLILESKILMRESWLGKPTGWDDPLPDDQGERWMTFLSSLMNLGELRFRRSLWPAEEVVGLPVLIVFSDGSLLAYGTAAYIRWKLKNGGYWTRLIMAKSKIAPKNILSIPRMELNSAVLGNRVKNFILKETNLKFARVYQLVDSSTVLGYLYKESGVFKPYEGIRISEIQSTNTFTEDGNCSRLAGFAWVACADWCTKPRPVKDLLEKSFWQNGADFMLLPEEDWPIKFSYQTERLEGELVISKQCHVAVVNVANVDLIGRIVHNCSSWNKMQRLCGWILRLVFPSSGPLRAEEVRRSKVLLIKYAQKDIDAELKLAAESG